MHFTFHLFNFGLMFLIALTTGCATKHPHPPIEETDITQEEFFAPYEAAYAAVAKEKSLNRELIQLGLPAENSVSFWYALAEQSDPSATLRIAIVENGNEKPVDARSIKHFTNENYNTGRIEINGLEPGRSYEFIVRGAGLAGKKLIASTRPSERTGSFSFLFSSCFQPYTYHSGIFNLGKKTWIAQDSLASMRNLRARAESSHGPSFYLAIGDQYYVDPGASLFFGSSPIAYLYGGKSQKLRSSLKEVPNYLNRLNRLHFALPDIDATFTALPSVMMWDDHDIRDGWGSHGDEHLPGWISYYEAAREAFVSYQAARNPEFSSIVNAGDWDPDLVIVPRLSSPDADNSAEELNMQFDWGLATFFVVDGRSDRNYGNGRGMSEKQFEKLENWLNQRDRDNKPTVFVFAYPVPVLGSTSKLFRTANHLPTSNQDDIHDRILRHEQIRLIEMFTKHFQENPSHKLLVLSGDVHYSGLQTLKDGKDGAVLGYEIITSGLAQTQFNSKGPKYGTAAGFLPETELWLQNQGYYSGPSFAEIFVGSPQGDDPAPEIRLLFYPATLEDRTNLELAADRVTKEFALPISSYPPNTGEGRYTDSELREKLKEMWLQPGYSSIYPGGE